MYIFTTRNLSEPLTLLIPDKKDDGEGGWEESWKTGPVVWAAVWPLVDKSAKPYYRIVVRASVEFADQIRFLWPLRYGTKRLRVMAAPVLIQNNHFQCMTAVEDAYA